MVRFKLGQQEKAQALLAELRQVMKQPAWSDNAQAQGFLLEATELAFWDNQIQTIGLTGVANGFVMSQECRFDNVIADLRTFLHRTPSGAEVIAFAASPGDLLTLEALVLDSHEFLIKG